MRLYRLKYIFNLADKSALIKAHNRGHSKSEWNSRKTSITDQASPSQRTRHKKMEIKKNLSNENAVIIDDEDEEITLSIISSYETIIEKLTQKIIKKNYEIDNEFDIKKYLYRNEIKQILEEFERVNGISFDTSTEESIFVNCIQNKILEDKELNDLLFKKIIVAIKTELI